MAIKSRIGVGIIGANPEQSWAKNAHIPALRALADYELRALSTSRKESAQEASRVFGVPLAFDNHQALVEHPDVDLVVVSVKVPQHRELVEAAVNAGKMVYCEWPLGRDLAEAEHLAALARSKGVRTIVGLQARASPAVARARDLIAGGYVGEVLSTNLVGTGWIGGGVATQSSRYLLDVNNGATLLSIPFGHTVDALCWSLGEFSAVSATLATRRPQVKLVDTGETVPATAPDQVAVTGVLRGGAVASLHYRGGTSRQTNLLWEINGTEGDLVISGDAGNLQMTEVKLRGGRGEDKALSALEIPERYHPAPQAPAGSPYNVAQAYAQFAADLRQGTSVTPTFEDAVIRHRMLDAIERAAKTGERQTP
ncbi:MAG: Gfo/Idh/MocA family oxidoreductase [Cystobacter sp.]